MDLVRGGHVLHVAAVDERGLDAALAHGCARAVHGGEAAADDHDALALVIGVRQAERSDAQVLQAVDDAVGVLAGDAQLVGVVAADGHQHRVVALVLQVVDGVQVHVVEPGDRGLDVAGHRDVDGEDRLALAHLHCFHELLFRDDRFRAGGRGDQDVGFRQRALEFRQRHGVAAEFAGQVARPVDAAIGDEQPADVLAGEVLGDEFHGDTGTDEQRRVLIEPGEELVGEAHGGRGDRDRVGADLGVGANLLGHGERVLEQPAQVTAQRIGLLRIAKRILQLPENLGLTEHHRVEPARDAEDMSNRFLVLEREYRLPEVVSELPVVVDFWASWCEPCKRSFPWMNELQTLYGEDGFEIIAVNLDTSRKDAEEFLKQMPAKFDVAFDKSGKTAEAYNLKAMPSSFLIDTKGRLVHKSLGYRVKEKKIVEKKIQKLVGRNVVANR